MKFVAKYFVIAFLTTAIATAALLPANKLEAHSAGAPAGVSGSPKDASNCSSCHSGTASTLAGLITSNIPPEGYDPQHTYIITATMTSASISRFGFEISPQTTGGTLLGTMTLSDAARTQLVGSGKYITHTSAGTSGAGSITWSFNWKAPGLGTGAVTFYGAFIFANNNNNSTGDLIRLSTLTVQENLITSVDLISEKDQIKLWPNPVADVVHFSMPAHHGQSSIRIFNSSGSLVREMNSISTDVDLDLSSLTHGIYCVSLNTDKGSYFHKLVKE